MRLLVVMALGLVLLVLEFSGTVESFASTRCIGLQHLDTSRRWRQDGSLLFMTPEENRTPTVRPAQVALKSSNMAKSIRRSRRNRGRTDSPALPVEKEDHVTPLVSFEDEGRVVQRKSRTRKEPAARRRLPRRRGSDLSFDSALKALQTYHSIHRDLVIPRRFVVPVDDAYPEEWHDVDLSTAVYCLQWWQRNVRAKPDRVAELNELGFVWGRLQPEWNLVLEALITYYDINGDILVPNKFVVPHGNDTWPKATWGSPLGNTVYRIRARNDFLRGSNAETRRNQLNGLGFIWDVHEHRFRKFYTALRHFARLEGYGAFSSGRTKALRVPSTFVVPKTDDWPKELWGFQLGCKCTAVRQKELYVKNKSDRQQALVDLGFRWSGNADLGWLEVVHAAAIYSRMGNRTLDVPYHFVVPVPPGLGGQSYLSNGVDWPWPEHLWGLPLGQRLKDVRLRGAYLSGDAGDERRRQLDALGFNWNPKRGRRKKVAP